MIVVADTSPIQYLHLVGRLDLLRQLFSEVQVPTAVLQELLADQAPTAMQVLARNPPEWFKVHDEPPLQNAPHELGLGERAALSLALRMSDSILLLDDGQARRFAHSLGLKFTGTIGIVLDAERRGLLRASEVLADLQRTNMRMPPEFRGGLE